MSAEKLVIGSVADLQAAVGVEVGPTDWFTVDQSRIDGFADDTEDHQWIHVDTERAAKGPFGATIAHGFLTVSLIPYFNGQLREIANLAMGVNYGLNKVRFPSAVRAGSRIRARMVIVDCDDIGDQAVQIVSRTTIEVEGGHRPVCVADLVARYYFAS